MLSSRRERKSSLCSIIAETARPGFELSESPRDESDQGQRMSEFPPKRAVVTALCRIALLFVSESRMPAAPTLAPQPAGWRLQL